MNIIYCFFDIISFFLKKIFSQAKSHSTEDIYGISQDPDTKNYILIFEHNYFENECCKQCGNNYTCKKYKWCKPCQINHLKKNFTKWTSGNKQIDKFIQERQLETGYTDVLFEWVPYNQFNDIEEIGINDFTTVHLAVWKDGTLYRDYKNENKWIRESDQKVVLKCFSLDQSLYEV